MAALGILVAAIVYVLAHRWVARRIGPPFRIAIDNPAGAQPNAILDVTCCRQMEEVVFVHLTGRVRNVGPRPLKMVIARARYFDREGHEIASAQSMVNKPVLEPGDKPADFMITTPVNLAITRATVDFRQPAGQPIPARYRDFGFNLSD
ncbi:MAG TPA: FxLYD domain-containing protein [Candidatus Binataceae bacterium]|nr:FxLYD domain-containing protein [Candidatus Binataceae bacterium]